MASFDFGNTSVLPKFLRLHQLSGPKVLIFHFCNLETKNIIYLSIISTQFVIKCNELSYYFLLYLETSTAVNETAGIETNSFLNIEHQIINLTS